MNGRSQVKDLEDQLLINWFGVHWYTACRIPNQSEKVPPKRVFPVQKNEFRETISCNSHPFPQFGFCWKVANVIAENQKQWNSNSIFVSTGRSNNPYPTESWKTALVTFQYSGCFKFDLNLIPIVSQYSSLQTRVVQSITYCWWFRNPKPTNVWTVQYKTLIHNGR